MNNETNSTATKLNKMSIKYCHAEAPSWLEVFSCKMSMARHTNFDNELGEPDEEPKVYIEVGCLVLTITRRQALRLIKRGYMASVSICGEARNDEKMAVFVTVK